MEPGLDELAPHGSQGPIGLGPSGPTGTARLVLAASVALLLVVGVALAGRVLAPPQGADDLPAPTAEEAGVPFASSFTSELFGYSLTVPAGWAVENPFVNPGFVTADGTLRAIVWTEGLSGDRRSWPWATILRPYSVDGATLESLVDTVRESAELAGAVILVDEPVVVDGIRAHRVSAAVPPVRSAQNPDGTDRASAIFMIRDGWQQVIVWFGPTKPRSGDPTTLDEFLATFVARDDLGVFARRSQVPE